MSENMSQERIWVTCTYCSTVNALINSRCCTCNSPLPLPEYLEAKHRMLKQRIDAEQKEIEEEQLRIEAIHRPFWQEPDYVHSGLRSQKIEEHYYPDYSLPEFLKNYTNVELVKYYSNEMLIGLMSGALTFLAIVLFPVFIWFNTQAFANMFTNLFTRYEILLQLVFPPILMMIVMMIILIDDATHIRK